MKNIKYLVLLIVLFNLNHVFSKLFPIEEKYPLLVSYIFWQAKITFIAYSIYIKYIKGKEPNPGSLWPKPLIVEGTSEVFLFFKRTEFTFKTNLKENCDIINENFKLYKNILFTPNILYNPALSPKDNQIKELNFEIFSKSCPDYPSSDMDESCKKIEKLFLVKNRNFILKFRL